jgi:HEAT repeat protein
MVARGGLTSGEGLAEFLGFEVLQPLGRRDANELRYDALQAFAILRETGAPATTGLSNLLYASDSYRWPTKDPIFRSVRSPECLNWLRQRDAAYCLGFIGPAARGVLLQGLENAEPGIRAAAAYGLGLSRTTDSVVVEPLVRHLDDANTSVRITVARSLGLVATQLGQGTNAASVSAISPMVAPLMRCLSDADLYLRCYAAVALGNCRSTEALPLVADLVTNGNIGGGTLAILIMQALTNITEHPVNYGAQPPKASASP